MRIVKKLMVNKVAKARFDDGRDRGELAAKATIRFACGRSSGIIAASRFARRASAFVS